MITCDCTNNTLGNTGTVDCDSISKVAVKLILVPLYDDAGVKNSITIATPLTQVVVDALINQADESMRWYPLPEMDNVAGERAESLFETTPSGKKYFIKQGTRSYTFELLDRSAAFKGQLDKVRCGDAGVYIIDNNGSLTGMALDADVSDGKLYPIKIDKNSWDARLAFATDTTIQKIMVSFDFAQAEDDSLLRVISSSDIPADLSDARGLLDVNATYSAISTTGFTARLQYIYGSVANLNPDTGLLIGDFAIYNTTTLAAVTILTATETPDGTYAFTFAAQTVADVLSLTPTKAGRDYANVISNLITI